MKKKGGLLIFLASDHAGFELKEKIKEYLSKKDIFFEDLGPYAINPEDDYPDYILKVANKVTKYKNSLGIVIGGSGQGEAIAANKVKGIRAATIYSYNPQIIKLSKEHNNTNIISFGARFISHRKVIKSLALWLSTPFSNAPRHLRRIKKISAYENKK